MHLPKSLKRISVTVTKLTHIQDISGSNQDFYGFPQFVQYLEVGHYSFFPTTFQLTVQNHSFYIMLYNLCSWFSIIELPLHLYYLPFPI